MTHASEASPADGRFGPSLPVLLRRRFGVPQRVTIGAVVLLLLFSVVVVLLRPAAGGQQQLVHSAKPVFNLLYRGGALHPVTPRDGALARLEGSRPGLAVSVQVSALPLPSYAGNVVHGLLPAYASRYTSQLRRRQPGFQLVDEGKARFNNAQGYQVGFVATGAGLLTHGRDVMLVRDETSVAGAILLSIRQDIQGPVSSKDQHLINASASAFRSFCFGKGAASHFSCG
jgi:hypothetical protein